MTERSEVQFGTTRIQYAIRRTTRKKTVSIAVLPADGVLLTAPAGTKVSRLDALVHEKARWIVERLRTKGALAESKVIREFVSGESFWYLGRQYRLRVVPDAQPRPLAMRGAWLEVHVPRGLGEEHRGGYVRAALVDWYRKRAGERLPSAVAEWAQKVGVAEPKVLVRDQQKRWASCDAAGVVRVNWRVVQAAPRLVDYVLAHEVVHLVHGDHGAAFWRALGRVMPDYEERRGWLRDVGGRMEW